MSIKPMPGPQVLKLRLRLGLNQNDFWEPLGLTQSTGSRYERRHWSIPPPLLILLDMAYGKDPQRVLQLLRSRNSD